MKEENIGVLSAGERFGFKGFEWIVLDNNVDGGVLAVMTSACRTLPLVSNHRRNAVPRKEVT